jgi:hypothetical protein
MTASNAYRETPAEREAVAAWMKQAGVSLTKPARATVVPIDRASRKKPLFLAPIESDDDRATGRDGADTPGYLEAKRLVAEAVASLSEAARTHPATIEDIFEGLELPLAIQFDDADAISKSFRELRAEIVELKGAHRNEVAELRLSLTEARCEVRELKALVESARTLSRGEQGLQGPRGVPGSQGAAGPRGEQGERGAPAAMIAAYEPRVEQFQLVPVYTTGERGVPMSLRPFFDSYDAMTAPEGDDEA